jgi:hypothetical protein
MQSTSKPIRWIIFLVPIALLAIGFSSRNRQSNLAMTEKAKPAQVESQSDSTGEVTMADVLEMARAARRHLTGTLDDYTARLVKQEMDRAGVVGPEEAMEIKVQTRVRGDREDAPLRVYLRFVAPEPLQGREVSWGEDLYDGKMAVHEVGLLLSLKTLWLDPQGIIAMQGQRYPITQIGLVGLVDQLIERGEKDVDDPNVSVTLTDNHSYDGLSTQLIRVRRAQPSSEPDDFSLAEIVIDPERQLVLSFRSFGWPVAEGDPPPILESYSYYEVETNVGLTEADFDTGNPEYQFPAL